MIVERLCIVLLPIVSVSSFCVGRIYEKILWVNKNKIKQSKNISL